MLINLAEGAGFEPAVPFRTLVFEASTFDHSDTLPNSYIITQKNNKVSFFDKKSQLLKKFFNKKT